MESTSEQKQTEFAASSCIQKHPESVGTVTTVVGVLGPSDNNPIAAKGDGRDRQNVMVKHEFSETGRTVRYGGGELTKNRV
jgi:hypothetical protein